MIDTIIGVGRLRQPSPGYPQVGARRAVGELEPIRHHTDHRERPAIERQLPAHSRDNAAQTPTRECRADHHYAGGIVIAKRPPGNWIDAQHTEQRPLAPGAGKALGCGDLLKRLAGIAVDHHGFERSAQFAPCLDVLVEHRAIGVTAAVAFGQLHQAFRLGVWQGPQQHAAHDAEHYGVGADSQRERANRDRKDSGSAGKGSTRQSDLIHLGKRRFGDRMR